jgi:hypothetical protein
MKDQFLLMGLKALNCRPQGDSSLSAAIQHNKRTLNDASSSSINASRSHLNYSLFGLTASPEEVVSLSKSIMAASGYQPKRKDSAICIEGVYSLRTVPTEFDMNDYFRADAEWQTKRFGGTLIAADVHLDEEHPHCHVVVQLPMVNGGMSGSNMLGDRVKLNEHKQDFFISVATKFGLRMPPKLTASERKVLLKRIHEYLRSVADPVMVSCLWPWVSCYIERDPLSAAEALGIQIEPAAKPSKTC